MLDVENVKHRPDCAYSLPAHRESRELSSQSAITIIVILITHIPRLPNLLLLLRVEGMIID